jgi:predicted O-methyltransferase YrrM
MGSEVDLNLIFLKADEMYDKSRPGFIHALRKPHRTKGWTELTFPSGLICTTNSSPVETELTYNEVFEGREYLRSGIELSDHDTIIDVGANIGMFTMYLLTNLDGPTIHAIEPVPDTFEVLRQNVQRYRNGNVCAHNTALGAIPDSSMDIVFFPVLTGNSTAHPEIKEAQRESSHLKNWFIYTLKSA